MKKILYYLLLIASSARYDILNQWQYILKLIIDKI